MLHRYWSRNTCITFRANGVTSLKAMITWFDCMKCDLKFSIFHAIKQQNRLCDRIFKKSQDAYLRTFHNFISFWHPVPLSVCCRSFDCWRLSRRALCAVVAINYNSLFFKATNNTWSNECDKDSHRHTCLQIICRKIFIS